MSERTQIGIRVDASLWEEFRNDVEERKGQTRGVLGSEVEKALRQYLYGRSDESAAEQMQAMREQLTRIENKFGSVESDGGADTLSADEHTHTRHDQPHVPSEKPSPNVATDKKVAYLAGCIEDDLGEGFGEVARVKLVETVKGEYGFRSDTAKRYVERLIDHFDLCDHPTADGILVSPSKYDDLLEQRKDELREEAEARL